jgi:hypothetical protein
VRFRAPLHLATAEPSCATHDGSLPDQLHALMLMDRGIPRNSPGEDNTSISSLSITPFEAAHLPFAKFAVWF